MLVTPIELITDILSERRAKKKPCPWEPQPGSPLLRLPGEILNRIYRLVLISDTAQHLGDVKRPGLIATCRQMREEGMPIFLKENKFIWKLPMKIDWTLQKPPHKLVAKWLRKAATSHSAHFGELAFWLVAPPKTHAFDLFIKISPTVAPGPSLYHETDYFYCTTATANFCGVRHTCDNQCWGTFHALQEHIRHRLDKAFRSLHQLRMPELGICDVMDLGKGMTEHIITKEQKRLAKLPVFRESAWNHIYLPTTQDNCVAGRMESITEDLWKKV